MDIKVINRKIGEIRKSGKALQGKIVEVEIAAMQHLEQHKDSGALSRLVLAVPASIRREALKVHITDHVPVTWDDEKQVFKSKKKGNFNITGAEAVPFYEYTKESAQKINLDKLLVPLALIEAAQKRVEKALEEGEELTGDMEAYKARLERLRSIAA
jgi:hypothetical protein